MKTMLRMGLTVLACTSCSTISPVVRSAVRPMVPAAAVAVQRRYGHGTAKKHSRAARHVMGWVGSGGGKPERCDALAPAFTALSQPQGGRRCLPVAQKVQPMAQPTSDDTHSVERRPPSEGMASKKCSSSSSSSSNPSPAFRCPAAAPCSCCCRRCRSSSASALPA